MGCRPVEPMSIVIINHLTSRMLVARRPRAAIDLNQWVEQKSKKQTRDGS
jgi:hypothetical protein